MRRIFQISLAAVIGAAAMYNVTKKKKPRIRKRHQHFLAEQSGTQIPISQNLLRSAHLLLARALEERKQPVWRTHNNHTTWFAPAIVITVLTAFDAWLNELIGIARTMGLIPADEIASLINKPVYDRYRETARHLIRQRLTIPKDLTLLTKVRDEIVHFLPYVQNISSGKTVPDWLIELERKQLLIHSGRSDADFHFSQKLCSYALSYWACETTFSAASDFASRLDADVARIANVDNFSLYQAIAAPADLEEFDRRFGLTMVR